MNWPKIKPPSFDLVALLMVAGLGTWLTGCGVKGDPLPPERPVELGRGRPTYKRATEGIPIERAKPAGPAAGAKTTGPTGDKDEDEDEDAR